MRALVIGGGGFVGRYIVEKLIARGDEVTSLSRHEYPWMAGAGVKHIQADITDRDKIISACKDIDALFHTSARVGIWGSKKEFYDVNVGGTQNIIDACLQAKVKRLIYTSSPSVIFDGSDLEGIDESYPYPKSHIALYPETKAIAERAVVSANGTDRLYTCALRPHLVWGPRDTNLIPRLIDRARSGRLKAIGDRTNIIDAVYVENVAQAHILACDRLIEGSPVGGSTYFITNDQPVNCWEFLDAILQKLGEPAVTKMVSYKTAYWAGGALELLYRAFGITREPAMTRFLASSLAMSHYFNIDRAKNELGYTPSVTMDEGLKRLAVSLKGTLNNRRYT